jgi:glycosyltransferase involved in cell wall biosynthesis
VQLNESAMPPQVTVLMSVHNNEQYLPEAIESIVNQVFSDFEFLILNDASTDGSRDIIRAYADPRIRLIENERNLGLTASLNRGIDLARGAYIARMDADDIALPERLHRQVAFMEGSQDIDVCGSWYELFGDRVKLVKSPVDHQDISDTLFFKNCIAHSTVCIRKQLFAECAVRYNEAFEYAQDYELWCRIINKVTFANMPEVLLKYRIHGSQSGTRHIQMQDDFAKRVQRKNLQLIGLNPTREEENIYFDVVMERFIPKSKDELTLAAALLKKIYSAGQAGHGSAFRNLIRRYMKPLPEKSIRLGAASMQLFRIFLKTGVFSTGRDKARYVYHCFRNMAGV